MLVLIGSAYAGKILFWGKLFFWYASLVAGLYFLVPLQGHAQITIRERMELNKQKPRPTAEGFFHNVLPEDPILYPLGDSRYLVLKTGTLNLYVAGAQGYGPVGIENTLLSLTKGNFEGFPGETTYNLAHFLYPPIVINDRSNPECSAPRWFYRHQVELARGSGADSYVSKSHPDKNYGNYQDIALSQGQEGFIKFGLGNLSIIQNGQLMNALMQIQAASIPVGEQYPSFTVAKATGPWKEYEITWNNRPGSDSGFLITDENTIGASITIRGDTLRMGIFQFNFYDFATDAITGGSDYGIVLKSNDGYLKFASSEIIFGQRAFSKPRICQYPTAAFKFNYGSGIRGVWRYSCLRLPGGWKAYWIPSRGVAAELMNRPNSGCGSAPIIRNV